MEGGFAMVKVFLVDDHEVVRRGIVELLGSDPELDVVGEAGSVAEAMTRIPAAGPDVAVLDVRPSPRWQRDRTVPGFAVGHSRVALFDADLVHLR